jgi:hypothetical protein
MVHSLVQARQALAVGRPVILLSAPGAGVYAGAGWWLALVAAAAGEGAAPPHVLDCGGAAGRALEALRAGQKDIVLQAPEAIFAEVSVIAASFGATVLGAAPASLNLGRPGAARCLAVWLGSPSDPPV